MKTFLRATALAAATFVLPLITHAASPGELIKIPCAGGEAPDHACRAVYFYGGDGRRHAFPNERVYFTWYANFNGVKTISEAEMAAPMLVFTDAAAAKVKSLIDEEANEALKLRVFITGGGCSGFQYGFTFDEAMNEGDTVIEKSGVTLLVDPMSFQYLVGAEIDYSEGLEGAHFVIRNPNATTTCGCGSSFSV